MITDKIKIEKSGSHLNTMGAAFDSVVQEGRARQRGGQGGVRFQRIKYYAVKELPHPHPPVALGLLKVKPEPMTLLT